MVVSHIVGFEAGSLGEVQNVVGSPTVQGTTVRTGSYALRCNASAAATYVIVSSRAAAGTNRTVTRSLRFYLRVGSLPSAETTIAAIVSLLPTSLSNRLRLKSDGTLAVANTSGVDQATSTSALTADGQWHRIDYDNGYNAGVGTRVYVDGILWAESAATATSTGSPGGAIGVIEAVTADLYFDDVVWYDSVLPATLDDYNVNFLKAVSDSAAGTWHRPDGTTGTSLFSEVDNIPPTGNISTTNTTGGRIENTTSSTTDNYDATCATYDSITGLTAGSQILAVQAICNDAQEATTSSPKAGAVVIASNPTGQTERSFDFGLPNGTSGSTAAAAMGTFPAGWGTHLGPVTESPTVTISAGPVARVGKRIASTREVDVDLLGVYVVWEAGTSPGTTPDLIFTLANPTYAPLVDTNHTLEITARQSNNSYGTATMTVELRQATTVIESWTETLTDTFTDFSHDLAASNIASITDYSDLRVRVSVAGTNDGGTNHVEISYIQLKVPAP